MDKLFLTGLLKRNASKREASARRADAETATQDAQSATQQPIAANGTCALYSNSIGAAASGSSSSHAGALAGIAFGPPYGGRPLEQLLFDVSTADLVILVADEVNYSRALPAHKEVLRSRNAGGYFARLLAEPSAFAEYSDKAAGPGSDAATGALAVKPMIRRMHWHWQLASSLLSFLYRDCCEVAWEQLPELRRAAEEVGAKGLCEAVDYLLEPQHLLPWTVADLRAAAAALRRPQLLEAADRYSVAMRATGVVEGSRMATVVYHTRPMKPKLSVSISLPTSLPSIDGATPPETPGTPPPAGASAAVAAAAASLLRFPSSRAFMASASAAGGGAAGALSSSPSFTSRTGALPSTLSAPGAGGAGAAGGGGSFTAGCGGGGCGSGSCCHKDSRVGLDVVDGVLRSVALDSKVLRGLLLPGRRRDTVLLCAGGGGGPTGHLGGAGRPRPLSGLSLAGNGGAAAANTVPPWRPTAAPAKGSATELPQLGSRLRLAAGSNGGGGGGGGGSGMASPVGASGSSFTGGTLYGPPSARSTAAGFGCGQPDEQQLEAATSGMQELVVIVPAAHLAASLAALVQRPLDSKPPGAHPGPPLPLLVGGPGGGAGGGGTGGGGGGAAAQQGGALGGFGGRCSLGGSSWKSSGSDGEWRAGASRPSFDPFGKLSGLPGLSWGGVDKGGSSNGVCGSVGATAPCASLLQQLPTASSLGNFDQISLALALDFMASVQGGSPTGNGGNGGSGFPVDGSGGGGGGPFTAAASPAAAAAAASLSTSRLLSSVLATLGAADNPQFIVRADSVQAAQAVAFERRRAASDMSSLHSLAGALGASGGGGGAGGGGGGGLGAGGGSGGGGGFSTSTACSAAASAVKTVLGPTNPREYFIPLPDHSLGAISITLPVGLVLVDPATLEAVSGGGGPGGVGGGDGNGASGFGYRSDTDSGSSVYGSGIGGVGGGVCSSARVAALMPHLAASTAALTQVISAVGMVSQVLRVAGEQHGLFSVPALRASLRITNPSTAMLNVLSQTNTYFAVGRQQQVDSTIYIRKPPADLVRLLQALHSTLPVKSRGSNEGRGHLGGGDGFCSPLSRARLSGNEQSSSFAGGPGPALALQRQGSRQRSVRASLEVTRTSTSTGYGSSMTSAPPPLTLQRSMSRRSTFSELRDLRAASMSINSGGSGSGAVAGSSYMPYSHGVPYSQLERLFPGWHLHVVELSPPGVMVDEF
ncbi:hypothetical protein PLESTB_000619100 [Pleodorina starrii]|uniref:BTB domain-containing protein n=1 Tax=Pleodorina starrii TaxID=330485 RepID=A0A9W6BHU6_9CHLO|nr:hypothetical protein PLESTM_001733800 [Pleodorina starrii]GLC52344.1 hypothetical protein PLESTB_000619100 [Pleodorina starrii]GLC67988.1 hypothetical protein PLESTF_000631200 [Pleodorina starrii]